MKNKGVSAVVGVILMVAITVLIASTIYYYVSSFEREYHRETINESGILQSVSYTFKIIRINNTLYENVQITDYIYNELKYLVGHDITISFIKSNFTGYDYRVNYYYLNI